MGTDITQTKSPSSKENLNHTSLEPIQCYDIFILSSKTIMFNDKNILPHEFRFKKSQTKKLHKAIYYLSLKPIRNSGLSIPFVL